MLAYGKYFPLNSIIRNEFRSDLNNATIFMITSVPGSGTVGMRASWLTGGAGFATIAMLNLPLLSVSGALGGATSIKASKIGVELENTTQYLNTAGRVYVADIDARLFAAGQPTTMIGTQWDDLANTIKAFPETRLRAARHFVEPKKAYGHVVDDVDYGLFDSNIGLLPANTFGEHIMVWPAPSVSVERARPMSTLVVLVESTGASGQLQDYTMTVHAQHLTRWPLSTVPGQAMKEGKAADPLRVARAREAANAASISNQR